MPSAAAALETTALVLASVPVLLLLASGPALLHPRARRGPHLAALGVGVVLAGALPVLWRVGLDARGTVAGVLAGIVLLLAAQVGCALVVLLLGWARLAWAVRRRPPTQAEALVVLGAGLVGTRVTVVLAHRLVAALRLHGSLSLPAERPTPADGHPGPADRNAGADVERRLVPVVVSGGQGPDEVISEAAAMQAFLVELGLDAASILLEDRSRSTRENLVHSAALVAERLPPRTKVRLVVVTNGFHVFRTDVLARALRLDVVVVGCSTPWHYLSRALARELVATLTLHPRRQLVAALVLVALGAWLGLG